MDGKQTCLAQHQLSNISLLQALQLREVKFIRLAFTEYFEKMSECMFACYTCSATDKQVLSSLQYFSVALVHLSNHPEHFQNNKCIS